MAAKARMPASGSVRLALLLGAIGWMFFMRVALAGDPAADMKNTFIKGYIKSAVKRGVPLARATEQAGCVYNVVVSSMTVGQFMALAEEVRHSQPPTALVPIAPEIKALCLGDDPSASAAQAPSASATQAPAGTSATQSAQSTQSAQWDDVDSSRVAHELGRLRAQEESRLLAALGHPVVLPTGACTAIVTVGSDGLPKAQFPIHCSDDHMQDIMRQAVLAAVPLQAARGSTDKISVVAPVPEPGIAPIQFDAGPRLDIADSIAVTHRVTSLRVQQVQAQVRSGERPSRAIFAHCSATIQVSGAGAPMGDFPVACDDPRIEDVMRQAVLVVGTPRAQPGSTVLLRVTALFPAP